MLDPKIILSLNIGNGSIKGTYMGVCRIRRADFIRKAVC